MPVLWYYLRGYVIIRVTGFSIERFLNLASYHHILFWDAQYSHTDLVCKTTLDAQQKLQHCAEKTGCCMELIGYGGMKKNLQTVHHHSIFAVGLLCFVGILYFLSCFIWVVKIEGNERVSTESLRLFCQEYDIHAGAWKRNIEPETVTKALLSTFSELSWVSVHMDGTQVTIEVAESIIPPETVDKQTPCDIVATADGVITNITTERGTPLVSVGDVVQKGDVLISSQVDTLVDGQIAQTNYVGASGEVWARTWTQLTEQLPLQYEQKQYQGETKKNYVWLIGETRLDIIQPQMDSTFDVQTTETQYFQLGDFQFPIQIETQTYTPYIMQSLTRTVEQAKQELEILCEQKAQSLPKEGETLEQTTIQYEVYTDAVRAICQATLVQQIGMIQPATVPPVAEIPQREE